MDYFVANEPRGICGINQIRIDDQMIKKRVVYVLFEIVFQVARLSDVFPVNTPECGFPI